MCIDCGCSDGATATMTNVKSGEISDIRHDAGGRLHDSAHQHSHGHDHDHHHGHHHHGHTHSHGHAGVIDLQQSLLEKNDALAARNRAWLAGREVLMLNLVSSPGSGKTSLLERTIRDLHGRMAISVIEGDQATVNDGARIDAAGAPAIQVNTGTGCHLEADMIEQALGVLKPRPGSIVFVENVGNLVCPSLFDLGEKAKVAILSVTEGEDKPLKYPHMFRAAKLVLLNKIDLLPHLDFDVERVVAAARDVNPDVDVIKISARTGDGLQDWYNWLESQTSNV
ncbi:Hydrogenase nickel incorporation protein HypB [Roseivivax sediminis]|uniref:Hydrogenase maturation factor HypB n=2 Tax=Roseivivax sediminis TaxID=936889 RepID=A0A1I1XX77_9RHOB|nr:Hydrogenase nickel incorporation protein HypB [Roseivivax sediminis]